MSISTRVEHNPHETPPYVVRVDGVEWARCYDIDAVGRWHRYRGGAMGRIHNDETGRWREGHVARMDVSIDRIFS